MSLFTGDKGRMQERAVLLTLAAVQFTSIIDFMVIMPLGPKLMRELAINPAQFGWIVSSYTFSACVAGLFSSSLVDRFGRREAYLSLYIGFLVGTFLCGRANGYATLLAARVITGAFGGILGGMAMAIIGDVFPVERRGTATGALMSAFAAASVFGLPFGLYVGTRWHWHAPFLMLAGLGAAILPVAIRTLPPLRSHLNPDQPSAHPLAELRATMTHPNHMRAFALILTLMFGGFAVIPYIGTYLVLTVGVAETSLPLVYVVGGVLTLVAAPLIGKLADRFGKLRMYWIVAPFSAVMMLVLTNLPRVGLALAVAVAGVLMVANAGRMVVALAMVTDSVEPRRRGSFMSANSAVQHFATGLGAAVGGKIVLKAADGTLAHFDRVGFLAVAATLVSLFLAGRLRVAGHGAPITPGLSLEAAAEALTDIGEPYLTPEA